MLRELRPSLGLLTFFILLTGLIYPFLVTEIGQTLFPFQSSGSLVKKSGQIIGSELIGQNFVSNKYFHGRPSAAGDGYDASNSSGSNLAPTSTDLGKTLAARAADLTKTNDFSPIPVDLITTSASGLDPDISIAAAKYQAPRIAAVRHLAITQVEGLIEAHTTYRTFGFLGENRVNVLALNQALDLLPSP